MAYFMQSPPGDQAWTQEVEAARKFAASRSNRLARYQEWLAALRAEQPTFKGEVLARMNGLQSLNSRRICAATQIIVNMLDFAAYGQLAGLFLAPFGYHEEALTAAAEARALWLLVKNGEGAALRAKLHAQDRTSWVGSVKVRPKYAHANSTSPISWGLDEKVDMNVEFVLDQLDGPVYEAYQTFFGDKSGALRTSEFADL